MKFNYKFKYFLWGILILICIVFIGLRIDNILENDLNSIESYVLILFTLLIFMPFFSEVSIFGFKVKQQISDLRNDMIKEINNLKLKINNISNMNNNMDSHIYLGNEPSDKLIEKWEESARKMLKENNKEDIKEINNFGVSEDIITLFSARYKLEIELRRIWMNNFEGHLKERNSMYIRTMIRDLVGNDIINRRMAALINRVYKISTPAIHGEEVTEKKLEYVRMVMPDLIKSLGNIT